MRKLFLILVFSILLSIQTSSLAANLAQINYLTASGTNPVTISTQLQVTDGKINNTNLRFFIYDASNNLVASYGPISVPTLEMGATETFSTSWNWDTPGLGDHTVEVCWSPGNSSNCSQGQASTAFYSVSTLNLELVVVGVVLIAAWFFYNGRREHRKLNL